MTRFKTIAAEPGEECKHVPFTPEEEAAADREEAAFKAEAARTEYIRCRQGHDGYKSLELQLDMLYHDMTNETKTWIEHRTDVKKKFPKPEVK